MLDLLASLKMPKAGLNSIVFYYWYRMEDALDSAVIERLVAKTENLKMLVVYKMEISDKAKASMADLSQ